MSHETKMQHKAKHIYKRDRDTSDKTRNAKRECERMRDLFAYYSATIHSCKNYSRRNPSTLINNYKENY